MKRKRDSTVCQFVDIEARVSNEDENEDENDDTGSGAFTVIKFYVFLLIDVNSLDGFIEDRPVVHQQYVPNRHLSHGNKDSNEHGWVGPLVARLQERYGDQHSPAPLEGPSTVTTSSPGVVFHPGHLPVPLKGLPATPVLPEVGNWVQVQNGIYKGDVGYVKSTKNLDVFLLLVPRLPPPSQPTCVSQESPSHFRLFDPVNIKRVYGIEPTRITENVYSFDGCVFEHGLRLKAYSPRSISKPVHCMPITLFCLFLESRHPKLVASESRFPRPSEWQFDEGEEVLIHSSKKCGVITALWPDSVEVLVTGEGGIRVPWLDIRKVVSVGDFVEVTGGIYHGQKGWVDAVVTGGMYQGHSGWLHTMYDHVAGIVKDPDGQKLSNPDSIQVCDIPKNFQPVVLIFSSGV